MNFIELFLIAFGLSMDAFAVSICSGLNMQKATLKKATIVGLYFGIFQALMPLIGYLLASQFADKIITFDHWIAFILLSIIGGKMVYESFSKPKCSDRKCPPSSCTDRKCPKTTKKETSLKPAQMLPLAIATSIDALAVGVSFAFLKIDIVPAVSFIGITTLILSMIGVKIGHVFGEKLQSKAELLGGLILILIGVKILLEHLGMLPF